MINSLDDYYQLNSGLVVIETTNLIYEHSLFDKVKPQALLSWQRVRVANMMAHSGWQWYRAVRKHNSGLCPKASEWALAPRNVETTGARVSFRPRNIFPDFCMLFLKIPVVIYLVSYCEMHDNCHCVAYN